jgi:hypothetical protein
VPSIEKGSSEQDASISSTIPFLWSGYSTKALEKPRSIKDRIREQRKRNRRVTLAVIMIAVVAVSGIITYSILNQSSSSRAVSFKAAIVDQLSGTFPNPSFNDNTKTILVGAGYTVSYYSPDQVTVDFFRSLPSKGYSLLIIRAHSTGWVTRHPITIITSELWSANKYLYEQLTDSVAASKLADNKTYFVITSKFVRESMQGTFPKSIVIMMGCTGLKDSEMAQAFVARGAKVYVSWDKSVTADRTDNATTALLRSLAEGRTVQQAVSAAMGQAGPDPVYNSRLGFYPDDQATLALNLQQNAMSANCQVLLESPVPYGERTRIGRY